jgi:16S rRNA (cytidine1402-2'-O)-methyltransferase
VLTLVPTPIGNIADTSLRALEVFSQADVILCEDTRVSKKLIQLLSERHGLHVNNPRFIAVHSHNEAAFIASLSPDFFDANIVYASDAGMPGISDPGQLLVRYCMEHGITYDVLPGANAALSAFVASGFVTTQMLFFGFLPHKGADRSNALQRALYNGFTTVLYEAPHRLEKLLNELVQIAPQRQIFLAKEISKKYQQFFRATAAILQTEIGSNIKGEWVVVIEAAPPRYGGINEQDILMLDLPKKSAAKLIAKITGESPKACYERLINIAVE